ncbi:hypothetical protein [Virgibacillus sp. SK37]|uniref:hypothetical protein n=1 Tax=Virgibacillus sp. SK37 TaxID=403957 RepID=UPI0004D194D8|nr:hypothetical protein [Virgibacillus sp. SK37]AIF45726.1 hypothetical protein X953_19820 [Virgibacillus sp. SK37]
MKKTSIVLILTLLLVPDFVHAATILQQPYYDSSRNEYTLIYDENVVGKFDIKHWAGTSASGSPDSEISWQNDGSWIGKHYFTCNGTYEVKAYDFQGGLLDTLVFHPTEIVDPPCKSSPEGGDGGSGSGGSCDSCAFINCPGWGEYMGKVDQIINKIPSPPDWDKVAETFRDTIAPRIKSDMENMLGKAPALPPPPPPAPGVDDGNLQEPNGQEAPGLDDSTFNGNDIKDNAPPINERDDPTGGWDILNPIDQLPTQDEFKENAPDEGTAELPVVPEPDNPAPTPPDEPVNPAPTPPVEPDNPAPQPPDEPDNQAPVPGDTDSAPPVPDDNTGTAPVPGGDTGTPPTPGEDNNTAPLPDQGGTNGPIPGQDNSTAPMPNK